MHHEFSKIYQGAASASAWKVDVVDGGLFQYPRPDADQLSCRYDRISQFSDSTLYKLRTGENQQVNLADLYHAKRLRCDCRRRELHCPTDFSSNIVVDNDWTMSRLDAGYTGKQNVVAGGNSLINEAKITTYGSATKTAR